tara:strand:+ start:2712 stop:4463 length:1752 start_codon:yes stop_codon:yes gene_type:complete
MLVIVIFLVTAFIFSLSRGYLNPLSYLLLIFPVFYFAFQFLMGSHFSASWIKWVSSQGSGFSYWGYYQDSLTSFMILLVVLVFVVVCIFSMEYVGGDPSIMLFISYLFFFSLFMIILVTAPSGLQMFLGWEGVGLCSYLLINFWSGRVWANRSAIKAMVVNKVGDVSLMGALGALILVIGTTSWVEVSIWPWIGFMACVLFVIAVMAKSAQILLHFWLPDAMEGPTPVSALIHAATMVTAGVFLLLRGSALWTDLNLNLLLVVLGGITALYAALSATSQWDYKKIVAYSTCSQLGYMVLVCGFSGYEHSLFHLFNHGFFKALLFLGAGYTILIWSDEQDLRRGGGLISRAPIVYVFALGASLALIGFPYFSGYYSKEIILELLLSNTQMGWGGWMAYLAAFFTTSYSLKLIWVALLNYPLSSPSYYTPAPFPNFTYYLVVLLIFSLSGGWYFTNSWPIEKGFPVGIVTYYIPILFLILGSLHSYFSMKFATHSVFRYFLSYFASLAYLDHLLASLSQIYLHWSFVITYQQLDLKYLPKHLPHLANQIYPLYNYNFNLIVSYSLSLFLFAFILFFFSFLTLPLL